MFYKKSVSCTRLLYNSTIQHFCSNFCKIPVNDFIFSKVVKLQSAVLLKDELLALATLALTLDRLLS